MAADVTARRDEHFIEDGRDATSVTQCPHAPGTVEWKAWQQRFLDSRTSRSRWERHQAEHPVLNQQGFWLGEGGIVDYGGSLAPERTAAQLTHDAILAEVEEATRPVIKLKGIEGVLGPLPSGWVPAAGYTKAAAFVPISQEMLEDFADLVTRSARQATMFLRVKDLAVASAAAFASIDEVVDDLAQVFRGVAPPTLDEEIQEAAMEHYNRGPRGVVDVIPTPAAAARLACRHGNPKGRCRDCSTGRR